ncbi:MAG: hypothetical protein J6K14_03230 [Clostridia bacterium]|nr:hypothetical protein [Clostridia bacterium]
MIISFVGHRSLLNVGDLPKRIKEAIVQNIGAEENIVFYLGGYGEFDHLCAMVCRSIKENHPQFEMVLVTPYILGEKAKFSLTRFCSFQL